MTITTTLRPLTELDRRTSDGVEVALLWSRDDDRLFVTVTDYGTRESFTFHVNHEDALDAFFHPFAYAAARGIEYGIGRREAIAA